MFKNERIIVILKISLSDGHRAIWGGRGCPVRYRHSSTPVLEGCDDEAAATAVRVAIATNK